MLYIISKKTREIVWKVGPEYGIASAMKALGTIIGPHHGHIIPKGLPGTGNVLVIYNGVAGGDGNPNPATP